MKMVFLILLVIASITTWWLAIINWFQHDDHVAVGWIIAHAFVVTWTNNLARTMVYRR